MARIRTIKPEFFRKRKLFIAERDTSMPLRVAFAGLWTCADREGRFRWEPDELKLDALPYDDVDFAVVLAELEKIDSVRAYEVDGKKFGYIPAWQDHQVVNTRETASVLPVPPVDVACPTREPRENDASATRRVHAHGEGKGREGKGREVVSATSKPAFPDLSLSPPSGDAPKPATACPYQAVLDVYHQELAGLSQVRVLSEARKSKLKQRWTYWAQQGEYRTQAEGIAYWAKLFRYIAKSDFLMGRAPGRDGREPFMADFDFIVSPESHAKIVEGKYHPAGSRT